MHRRHFLTACGASLGVLAGCPDRSGNAEPGTGSPTGTPDESIPTRTRVPPLAGTWRSYQHDAANTGATGDTGPTAEPAVRWRQPTTAGRVATSPAASGGVFVVVTGTGVAYGRDASDGSVRWLDSRPVDADVAPVATEGTAVLAAEEGLVGLASETGGERWTVTIEGPVLGLATVRDRVVAATAEAITALSLADGTRHWRQSVDGTVRTAPGAGPGTVAVGMESGDVLALDADSGRRRVRVSAGTTIPFRPAVGTEQVFVPAEFGLIALDVESGDRRWEHETADRIAARPVTTGDGVAAVTLDDEAPGETGTPSAGSEGTPTPTATDVRWFRGRVVALSPDGEVQWRASRTERYSFTSGPPEELALTATGQYLLAGFAGTLVTYDAGTGDEVWSADAGAVTPAATDGVVSTGTTGIDLESGSVRWELRTGTTIEASPAVVGNTVYAGSDDNYLYAIAANTGDLEWVAGTDDLIRSGPAVGDDAVYVGTINGTLFAFDRVDGSELWTLSIGSNVRSPTLRDGTLYLGNFSETVWAVDAADGTVQWRTEVDAQRFVALEVAVGDGAVFAGANGDLRAFETEGGHQRWGVKFGDRSRVQSAPAAADGRVFVNIGEALRAFDTADGTEVWSFQHGGNANQPPVVHDGTVYAASDVGVVAVDAADGTEQWHRSSGGNSLTLAVTDEALYGGRFDTPLHAVDPGDGSLLWRAPGLEPSSPLAVAGNFLFFGDDTGSVRAISPE